MITRRYVLISIIAQNAVDSSFLSTIADFPLIVILQVKEDLTFTRNQIITSEVNISRIYNWDVRRKREAKFAGSK